MFGMSFLEGEIYHMTHIRNLENIFRQGSLFSDEMLEQMKLVPHSIANENVQNRRDRIFIWDTTQKHYRRLHSYVPFYFGTNSPMMYVQRSNKMLDQIVLLHTSRGILREQGVLFTDGNATNQQLSNLGEHVYIHPAFGNNPCARRYDPEAYGTNQNCSAIYSDPQFLQNLDWDTILMKKEIDNFEESKRIRSAEVLIPDSISLEKIKRISVRTNALVKMVHHIMTNCSIKGIAITCKPRIFPS